MSTHPQMPPGQVYRDSLDTFTDREEVLAVFQQSLRSAQSGQFHLLAVKGNSGTGKTFLIEYLTRRVCPSAGWQVGQLTFAQSTPDFRTILDGLEDTLKGCVPGESLKQYRVKRDEYNRRFDEYRSFITITQSVEAKEHASISGVNQSVQVNTDLRKRELQLRTELSRALLELAEESKRPFCLFIDGYERLAETDSEVVGWLWEEVLLKLVQKTPQPLLVMTCGWEWPSNTSIKPFAQNEILDDFDQARVRDYLHNQGIIHLDLSLLEQEELVAAFYDLTKGHPLVLSLAVIYFHELNDQERTAVNLRARRLLVDDKARVEFLDERLLSRLSEPYRTLLERGPILRSFDQAALRALLSVEIEGATTVDTLNDRAYERFLEYPFINRESVSGDALLTQPTFHELVRRVRLESLGLHPETKEQLHRAMVSYYTRIMEQEQRQNETAVKPRPKPGLFQRFFQRLGQWLKWLIPKTARNANVFTADYIERFVWVSEQTFKAVVESFYHILQVRTLQAEAFEIWADLTGRMVNRWRHQQAWSLLEVVRQLAEEGEPFLDKTGDHYVRYLVWYSRFLKQQARWEEARAALEEARQSFEHRGNSSAIASMLDEIGIIYRQEGKLEEALSYHERALALREQVGNPADIASSLNEIGVIYHEQRKLEEALRYYERSLALQEQVGDPAAIATLLNNIGNIYQDQGKSQEALRYHERALALREPLGNLDAIAQSLGNIGRGYSLQGKTEEALRYLERALALQEQVGNPSVIATWLYNIGVTYDKQGKVEEALSYLERTLAIEEPLGNLDAIATTLNMIGNIHSSQGKVEEALRYYERVMALQEQVGKSAAIAESLYNIGEMYRGQERLEEALRYYERALALQEQEGRSVTIAGMLYRTGETWREQGMLEGALRYYQRALAFKGPVGNLAHIATSFHNIGNTYREQGKLEQALSCCERALAIEEPLGDLDAIAATLNNIGVIYYQQGKLEKALGYHERALVLREQVGELFSIAQSFHNIASIYSEQEMWEQAIPYYGQSGSLYERLGSGFESDVADELEGLATCYRMLGELEKGLPYFMYAKRIRESMQKN